MRHVTAKDVRAESEIVEGARVGSRDAGAFAGGAARLVDHVDAAGGAQPFFPKKEEEGKNLSLFFSFSAPLFRVFRATEKAGRPRRAPERRFARRGTSLARSRNAYTLHHDRNTRGPSRERERETRGVSGFVYDVRERGGVVSVFEEAVDERRLRGEDAEHVAQVQRRREREGADEVAAERDRHDVVRALGRSVREHGRRTEREALDRVREGRRRAPDGGDETGHAPVERMPRQHHAPRPVGKRQSLSYELGLASYERTRRAQHPFVRQLA